MYFFISCKFSHRKTAPPIVRLCLTIGVQFHAHQLKNLHYPQVSKNVILSKKLARKDDIFYESFNSR
ncbi:hypothetical protein ELS81_32540 [Bacillus sp. VKPM B-3276]|nr:hypothetical protein ELS81_32540 [Bacillus sp. VKPM B-3276]